MRFAIICWLFLGIGITTAQQASSLTVRSIRFKLTSTNSKPLADLPKDAFVSAMKSNGIDLAVERKFDPVAVEKAAGILRKLYGDAGQEVRVEHTVSEIPPRSLEVSFEIVQLCACH
jgi:hypothetical protein